MLVKERMTPILSPSRPIHRCTTRYVSCATRKFSSLPVLDKKGKLVGIVLEKNCLCLAFAGH
jgi:CBS domain-containing protein